jgi:hypothetical protein
MGKFAVSLPALLAVLMFGGLIYAFLGLVAPQFNVWSDVTRVEGLLGLIAAATALGALHVGSGRRD